MMFRLGFVVGLVGLAQAFLIPPQISSAENELINTLPFENAVGLDGRVLEISCPGCPVMTNIAGRLRTGRMDSMLQFNLTLSSNADQLFLNGLPIYPVIDPLSSTFAWPLTASQKIKTSDGDWKYVSTPKLGYQLTVQHPAAERRLGLVVINLYIVEVDEVFLSGIPSIEAKLVETSTGKLMIASAEVVAAEVDPEQPHREEKECNDLLCKLRAIVAGAFGKGCESKAEVQHLKFQPKPHHHDHEDHDDHDRHKRPHSRPHGGRPSFRYHNKHGFARFLRGIVLHVFIPIVIGIMVGITASLFGMIVGHFIVFFWRLFFRRSQGSQYVKVSQEEVEGESSEEIASFLAPQGPPPQYEDAPSYQDAVNPKKTSE